MRHKALVTLVHLPFILMLLTGCSSSYRWSRPNTTAQEYNQDSAACKLVAMNAASNHASSRKAAEGQILYHQGVYDSDTGMYSGTSTEYRSPLEPVVNAYAEYDANQRAYRLCMKSKGYKMVKESTEKNDPARYSLTPKYSSIPQNLPGTKCYYDEQCPTGQACNANTNRCYSPLTQSTPGGKCKFHMQCPGNLMCDDDINMCVSFQTWESRRGK